MDATVFQQEAMALQPLLYQISYAMLSNNDDCADAVQEALLRAWKHRDSLRNLSAFKPWLSRILINACNDILRRRQRVVFQPLEEEVPVSPPEHDPLEIKDAIACLNPDQRASVVLHYLEGWSIQEIAHMMGVPAGTVKTRLLHARRKLERLLSEEVEA